MPECAPYSNDMLKTFKINKWPLGYDRFCVVLTHKGFYNRYSSQLQSMKKIKITVINDNINNNNNG